MSNNELTEISRQLSTTHDLQDLYLNINPIKTIPPDSFKGLTKLKILSLSSMSELWRVYERGFSGLESLTTLIISSNQHLTDIHYNAFQDLPEDVLKKVGSLSNITLIACGQ